KYPNSLFLSLNIIFLLTVFIYNSFYNAFMVFKNRKNSEFPQSLFQGIRGLHPLITPVDFISNKFVEFTKNKVLYYLAPLSFSLSISSRDRLSSSLIFVLYFSSFPSVDSLSSFLRPSTS